MYDVTLNTRWGTVCSYISSSRIVEVKHHVLVKDCFFLAALQYSWLPKSRFSFSTVHTNCLHLHICKIMSWWIVSLLSPRTVSSCMPALPFPYTSICLYVRLLCIWLAYLFCDQHFIVLKILLSRSLFRRCWVLWTHLVV